MEQQGHDDSPCACTSPLVGSREKKRKGRSNQVVRKKCSVGDLILKRTFIRKYNALVISGHALGA